MVDYQVGDQDTLTFIWFMKVLIWIGALALILLVLALVRGSR
jgi:hypothetical protein